MDSWKISALVAVSLTVSGASEIPLLSTSALLKGIIEIPHFVLFSNSAEKRYRTSTR